MYLCNWPFWRKRNLSVVLFNKFKIPLRTKSQSRELVYSQGKIKVNRIYNRKLFKTWTPKMAYVLGLLYTDGSIGYTQGKIYK